MSLEQMKEFLAERFGSLESRLHTFEARLHSMESRMEKLENQYEILDQRIDSLGSELEQKMEDGLARHGESVKYIKKKMSESLHEHRPPHPYGPESLVPISISTYRTMEMPDRPWTPPKPHNKR
jgi:chromosome segregation ATPase